jgi:folylpolyglutamate synthase/dihydropteroate synthase
VVFVCSSWLIGVFVCRMERFQVEVPSTTTDHLQPVTVVLDGSHNDDSVQKFLQALRSSYDEVWVLFGTGKDKNALTMMDLVGSAADVVIPVQARHYRAMGAKDVLHVYICDAQCVE